MQLVRRIERMYLIMCAAEWISILALLIRINTTHILHYSNNFYKYLIVLM